MTFQIGEKVVYPNQGVATIENISSRSFGSQFERFYLLRLAYSSMTVMVPFSHVHQVGLRKVTRSAEVTKVLDYLACGSCKCSEDWKRRFKENSDKMQAGSLLEIAQVFKSLVILQHEKPLSFREKKMLERARQMIVAEVATARSVKDPEAIDLLTKALSRASLRFPEAL
jgi:CarD family transcriptional regulator